jgi:hypothetical protein
MADDIPLIPAKAGIQKEPINKSIAWDWVPAFAGTKG